MLLLALACGSPEPPPGPPPPDHEAGIQRGADALKAAGIQKLTWGMAPYPSGEPIQENWGPIWAHVAAQLEVEIELVEVAPYGDAQERIALGTLDGATFWPADYVRAGEATPLQLVGTHMAHGSLTYGAYIITLEGQSIREVSDLTDLEGMPFGYVHPQSTSGFLYPAALLADAGIDPVQGVDARWLGTHAQVYDAVANGEVLAGAVFADELEYGPLRNPTAPRVRVVAKSSRIPRSAYAVRAGVPADAVTGIGLALNQIDTRTEWGRALLEPLDGVNAFLPVSEDHYAEVRAVRDTLETRGIQWPDDVE